MMRYVLWMALATTVAGFLTPEAAAQPREAPSPRHPSRTGDVFMDQLRHMGDDDIRELVETVRMVRLSQELGLTDEQTVVLVRHYNKIKEETVRLQKERHEMSRQLRDLVSGGAEDAEIEAKLAQLIASDKKALMMRFDVFERASGHLSTTQQAQLYMFLGDFERRMRSLIESAREQYRGRRPDDRDESAPREGAPRRGPGGREGFGRGAFEGRGPVRDVPDDESDDITPAPEPE